MPTSAIALTAAVLVATGCAPAPQVAASRPPLRHVDVVRLPDHPLHDTDPSPSREDVDRTLDPTDPAAVAIGHIAAGLKAQGLEIVDLGTDQVAVADDRVTVRVAATTAPGRPPRPPRRCTSSTWHASPTRL